MILYGLVLVVHVLISLILIGVILLQGGRGGMSEALSGTTAQSLFGGSAATVLTKATAICAGMFVITCLSLAYLSTVRGRSVIEQVPMASPEGLPIIPGTAPEAPPSAPDTSAPAPAATSKPAPSTPPAEPGAAANAAPAQGSAQESQPATSPAQGTQP